MTTYKETFGKLNRAALIPFFVIGDPDFETSLSVVKSAIDAGADVLELGIPFSDPIADGPTIQKADIRALNAGMTVRKALDFIKRVTDYKSIPIGLLVYYNLVYQYGTEKFLKDFKAAGGSSVLVADLSIDDSDEIAGPAKEAGLETVFMITPVTTDERAERIAEKTTGFIYTVSLLGVTGERASLSNMVKPLVTKLKTLTDVPVCVGFGVSSPQHAKAIAAAGADGVIIGSRIVKMIEDNLNDKQKMQSEISVFITQVKSVLE
ncbi:MAG TPA: tryptophan synthase subunit alpha [Planctomycetes bacterium]|nr:tryptophan synthase subunit alpha [Planctomycetota bacterium]HIJ70860.1 tryptophan synthase subunit alpha [Planctomycetota bacterium]